MDTTTAMLIAKAAQLTDDAHKIERENAQRSRVGGRPDGVSTMQRYRSDAREALRQAIDIIHEGVEAGTEVVMSHAVVTMAMRTAGRLGVCFDNIMVGAHGAIKTDMHEMEIRVGRNNSVGLRLA